MEKIKLNDGTLINITPNGIATSEKKRTFRFISSLIYSEIEALFENSGNISNIQYLSQGGEVLATFLDCVSLKSLSKSKNVTITDTLTADVYTVELSIDVVEKELISAKENLANTMDALNFLLVDFIPTLMA